MVQFENCIKYFGRIILNELSLVGYCFVAGGCVRDYFSEAKLTSDIDVYFNSEIDFLKIKDYLLNQTKEAYLDGEEKKTRPKEKAIILYENEKVVKVKYKNKVIDLVFSLYENPQNCIDKFDFTVSCAAVDLKQVYHHPTFFIDLAKRQLMINSLPFPLSTLWRLQKYIKKGYTICRGEMLKLSQAIGTVTAPNITNETTTPLDSVMSGDGDVFIGFD